MADKGLAWLKSNVLELIILILVLSIFINTFYGQAEKEASESPAAMEKQPMETLKESMPEVPKQEALPAQPEGVKTEENTTQPLAKI